MIQKYKDLNEFHHSTDPWGYEINPEDEKRKQILLSEIPPESYGGVLDIGCGQGFITRDLPGTSILGIDISSNAISHANKYASEKVKFDCASVFELDRKGINQKFDLIVITGVMYSQYIGRSEILIYEQIDRILEDNGVLVSVHIDEWYKSRFPYLLEKQYYYGYREYTHCLEVYRK